jgi:hypothetical protein
MKLFTRIVFGFNTLYQIIVGFMALILPAMIIEVYQGTPEEQHLAILRAAFRALGFNIILGGVISALIAKNPNKYPILLPLMGLLSILTIICWSIAWGAGEMQFSQFALDIVVQVIILVAVILYYPLVKKASA